MRIRRLVVRNFRAISHLDVEIPAGTTCVVGENNAGKSTIIHALRLVLDTNLPSIYRQLTRDDFPAGHDVSRASQVLVAVEFTDFKQRPEETALLADFRQSDDLATLCFRFRLRRGLVEQLRNREIQDGTFTIENYEWQIGGVGKNNPATLSWNDELLGSIRFDRLATFQVSYLQPLRDVEEDLRRARYSPLARLLDAANLPEAKKQALLKKVQDANKSIQSDDAITSIGKAIEDSIKATITATYGFGVKVGVADPTFASLTRSLVLLLTGQGLVDADASRNGLGLNNALYISMLLEVFRQRAAKPEITGQLMLVEEPEAHLHPELQRIIYQVLQSSNCQVIATTHSTHIASIAPLNSLIALTTTPSGSIAKTPHSAVSVAERLDLERYLDATRSTLFFARKVILVEGMSEVFLIPALVRHILKIDLTREGIAIVAIHGTHFQSYAKLFNKNCLPKKCAVITDGDLTPSDGDAEGGVDDLTNPSLPDLEAMKNEFFNVFHCKTTFELELASAPNLNMFAKTAEHLGAQKTAKALSLSVSPTAQELEKLQKKVLGLAKRVGKARFAQAATNFAAEAKDLPSYIKEAVQWIRSQA